MTGVQTCALPVVVVVVVVRLGRLAPKILTSSYGAQSFQQILSKAENIRDVLVPRVSKLMRLAVPSSSATLQQAMLLRGWPHESKLLNNKHNNNLDLILEKQPDLIIIGRPTEPLPKINGYQTIDLFESNLYWKNRAKEQNHFAVYLKTE